MCFSSSLQASQLASDSGPSLQQALVVLLRSVRAPDLASGIQQSQVCYSAVNTTTAVLLLLHWPRTACHFRKRFSRAVACFCLPYLRMTGGAEVMIAEGNTEKTAWLLRFHSLVFARIKAKKKQSKARKWRERRRLIHTNPCDLLPRRLSD